MRDKTLLLYGWKLNTDISSWTVQLFSDKGHLHQLFYWIKKNNVSTKFLFMAEFEEKAEGSFKNEEPKILKWWRYVEDVFAIMERQFGVKELLDHLNSRHGNI